MKALPATILALAFAAPLQGQTFGARMTCERLSSLNIANVTISSARLVPTATFRGPGAAAGTVLARRQSNLPPFCYVVANLRPSSDSDIRVDVWLPVSDWNGKFLVGGNGGWGGGVGYGEMTSALEQGYASAVTNTGHTGGSGDASWALGHPEKLADFAYRAVHEMAVFSKAVMAVFYGRGPRLSYFTGCSTGGRQGLMEAQRYPADFDGILAQAPANNQTHVSAWRMNVATTILKRPDGVIPPAKLALLNRAVVAACDAIDGVRDGVLADPRQCHFDPSTLLCQGADRDDCLTALQVDVAKTFYRPATKRDGEIIFPGFEPGGEMIWPMPTVDRPEPEAMDVGLFKYVAHEDASWDWRTFDLESDTALVEKRAGLIDATSPDLSAFKARGGKLIIYHGWSDTNIPPEESVNYYSSILARMGQRQGNWVRLFMVPGMLHCTSGSGADQLDWLAVLERWRESGVAPDRLIASRVDASGHVDMTRPLCPYPRVAQYAGAGVTSDAGNFVCKASK